MLLSENVANFLTLSVILSVCKSTFYGSINTLSTRSFQSFVINVEAISYLLLHNLHDYTFSSGDELLKLTYV